MAETPPPQELSLEISPEVAEGTYANLAMIAHSPSEFILDFIRLMPGMPQGRVKARIILTPDHAKRLLAALRENIELYERQYGPIRDPGAGPEWPTVLRGPLPEA
ncbi:MAG: DUF3467 domain-containing protein [Bacteroidetes bacterium]|nr:DUF3467 domain-containing protein [Rhodothermia bacterium]MCS7155753.1 DUF3467 domain-containing protein [Bacteroidota bacterium]MCX7906146.1 DUF3467 domain-containing protein [Bacteroidota bacterium]MDW8138274.1 DUF3467 domain-containing protein [Bacteroidota bacterium]MDW8285958.1 DUF3467 domain-containing protein [Bacteroidota bacterium]